MLIITPSGLHFYLLEGFEGAEWVSMSKLLLEIKTNQPHSHQSKYIGTPPFPSQFLILTRPGLFFFVFFIYFLEDQLE